MDRDGPVKNTTSQPCFILVPLYIYPTATSWDPLFSAAHLHPHLEFLVIINPSNGPGASIDADANYTAALKRLTLEPNVKILGYVYCSFGERCSAEVEHDIQVYLGLICQELLIQDIRLDGIFFDESPCGPEHVDYMAHFSEFARSVLPVDSAGLPCPAIIVYNPGIFVSAAYYEFADYIVVFENKAAEWNSSYVRQNVETLSPELRERSIGIAHSAGDIASQMQSGKDIALFSGFAGHFVTTNSGYEKWCLNWKGYVGQADGWNREGEDLV
ncbi:Spherulation-specific family 4 [Podospora didyma]|uniref:Spherulation-specific family 4 n=1 Tax=Podospora didyma TaxID=330526 RepID=A0AAE0P824_9PEZI|nr:Spherulation-specific family 4 [Podospora didyma]